MSEPGSAYRLSTLEERWRSDRSPRVFLQLADELRRAGRSDRAVEVLRDGLKWHPESVSGWVALGRLLLDEGEPAAAIEAFDRALERDPGQVVACKLQTESWLRLGDAARAASSLEHARLLSLPDADLEQLTRELEALRARSVADSNGSGPIVPPAAPAAGGPFDFGPPATLPALDLERLGAGRRGWRRVAIAHEPFAALLAASPARTRLEAVLREPGIFGGRAEAAETAESSSAPPAPALPDDRAEEMAAFPLAEAPAPSEPPGKLAEAEQTASAGEPIALATAATTGADAFAPARLPPEAIFKLRSIGEEVERETALEPELLAGESPQPPSAEPAPAATATLAALYLAQGHLDEAEREYRRVLAERADDAGARAGLEEVAQRRRESASPAHLPGDEAIPPGLTARRVRRLRHLYERLRTRRQGDRASVS